MNEPNYWEQKFNQWAAEELRKAAAGLGFSRRSMVQSIGRAAMDDAVESAIRRHELAFAVESAGYQFIADKRRAESEGLIYALALSKRNRALGGVQIGKGKALTAAARTVEYMRANPGASGKDLDEYLTRKIRPDFLEMGFRKFGKAIRNLGTAYGVTATDIARAIARFDKQANR